VEKSLFYHSDCSHFRGDLPCKPHKQFGVKCEDCQYYNKQDGIILIIKLGALGDVIRTTPLIEKLRGEFPTKAIWWVTYSPDILPTAKIDKIFKHSFDTYLHLKNTEFDIIYNLDKDIPACSLANELISKEKFGFTLLNGKPAPIDNKAQHKFDTGLFDDINKANTKSYVEEIFEICGFKFSGQEYVLDVDSTINWNINNNGKPIIGLNTGCGDRWISRLWADENWIGLIKKLQESGYYPLLLGGAAEDEKNKYFQAETGCEYLGHFSLKEFISLVNQTELVVTAVTMGMHITMGLKKKMVLMNNIFNKHEFELYGRGEIIEPSKECHCYFAAKCTHSDYKCMEYITIDDIYNSISKQVPIS
jgi:heptosyltransferase-2